MGERCILGCAAEFSHQRAQAVRWGRAKAARLEGWRSRGNNDTPGGFYFLRVPVPAVSSAGSSLDGTITTAMKSLSLSLSLSLTHTLPLRCFGDVA